MELAEDLHKPIIRKIEKRRARPPFIDNICGADLANIQLTSKFNKGFRFLLCVIDIYRKYAWFIPLKSKKKKYSFDCNSFQKFLNELKCKPNEIWVDKDRDQRNHFFRIMIQ